jgi:Glycosyl transferase family 2
MNPRWTILIATLSSRQDRLVQLLGHLLPQIDRAEGWVTVEALWNNGERHLKDVRQDLIEHAQSAYVSFMDDDDAIPPYFVEKVLPLLDGYVHFIGWKMQCIYVGNMLKPTYHSLKYFPEYEDGSGFYRNVCHLNPIRRDLVLRYGNYRTTRERRGAEDGGWVKQMRGHLECEKYIPDTMYYYHARPDGAASGNIENIDPGTYERPIITSPYFSYHPASSQ